MKNLKFYLIIGALAALTIWIITLYLKKDKELTALRNNKSKQDKEVLTQAKELSRKVNEQGVESVLFDVTDNKGKNIPENTLAATKGIIDTTAMALDIRTKQLNQVLVIKSSLEAENLKLRKQLDAKNRPYYTYSGQGLNLKFTPPYNELDTADQGTADFSADVNINATQYWKQNWFLGPKKSILAISSNSPLYKINGADFVEFEQKQPFFTADLQATAEYNFRTRSVNTGPSLNIGLGRIEVRGKYLYDPSERQWNGIISGGYMLLRK